MNEKVKKMLVELIEATIDESGALPAGSRERSLAVEDLEKLCKLAIEGNKADQEYIEKCEKRNTEAQQYADQLAGQKKDRWIKTVLEAVGLGISAAGLGLSAIWMLWGFDFEKTGAVSSSTFKWLIQKLKLGQK